MSTTSNPSVDRREAGQPAPVPRDQDRLPILDKLRFVAAVCVLLHHTIGVPYRLAPAGSEWLPQVLGSIWFGSAAVVVFFVISGFCVHAPYAAGKAFDTREFLIRRFVRVLIPLVVAVGIGEAVGVSYHPLTGMVTWSLVCELVYYAAYPLLRAPFARSRWAVCILVPGLLGYAALAVFSRWPTDTLWGMIPAVLIYAPGWIAGCWLAEARGRTPVPGTLWAWRAGTFACSFVLGLLHYRGVLDLSLSLPLFPLVVTPWLAREVAQPSRPDRLSAAGEWSYSLYILHPAAFHVATAATAAVGLGTVTGRIPAIAGTVVACWVFFRLVEAPSHRLARSLARRSLARAAAGPTAAAGRGVSS